jgi:hypothetical protein
VSEAADIHEQREIRGYWNRRAEAVKLLRDLI